MSALRMGPVAVALTALLVAAFLLTDGEHSTGSIPAGPRGYVVMLEDAVNHPTVLAERHAANRGARLTHVYRSAIKGYAAVMTPHEARNVARDPGVAHVEVDRTLVTTAGEIFEAPGPQVVHTRLHRILAADTAAVACEHKGTPDPAVNTKFDIDCVDDARVDVDIAVLDTAIDNSDDLNVFKRTDCVHPDNPYGNPEAPYVQPPDPEDPDYGLWHPNSALNEGPGEDVYGCLDNSGDPGDLSGYDDDPSDGEGHGTPTSNRAAAIDNGIGVVGVAPGARIWAVKVIDNGLFPEISLSPTPPSEATWVATYSFNEGSGSTVHDSGPGNHDGTIEGASWTPNGKYGAALSFDGKDDLVSIVDAAGLDLTNSFTMEAWVRPNALTNWSPVVSKGETAGGSSGYALAARGSSGPAGFVGASGSTASVPYTTSLPTGTWSHLTFTSDGFYLRLYVDGKLKATSSAISAKATSAELEIGHSDIFSTYFNGLIDEVRIVNLPFKEAWIQPHLTRPIELDPDPIASYSFDEGSGFTLHDSAGNHDGTVEGASWTSSGKYGSALDFDGTNDLVKIADSSDLDLTNSFTVEAWANPDSFSAARPLVSKFENPGTGNIGYRLYASAAGAPGIPGAQVANGTVTNIKGSVPLSTGAWSHLALTSDGTNLRFYVNGELAATEVAKAATATAGSLEIGHLLPANTYFDGRIDEVRLYDKPLSQNQIQADRDEAIDYDPNLTISHIIAGVDYVNEHADQIEVANMSLGCGLPWQGSPVDNPGPFALPCSSANGEALNAAIDATVDKGVVFVAAAGNWPVDTPALSSPQNNPNVIVTSVVSDCDGLPSQGSELKACSNNVSVEAYEDVRVANSAFGQGVTMAAPFPIGLTSGATPLVTGAAAVLASQCEPESAEDVQALTAALTAAGNTDSRQNGGWDDTSGDGYKEPLLDVGNEEIFDPVMVGEKWEPVDCDFEHPTPVAAYSFDEGSGTTASDSAGSHDGTVEGASWTSSGKYGSALDFDGTNDLVSAADANELDLTGAFTLEAWVRPDALSSWTPVIAKGENPGSGTSGYLLDAQSFDKPAGWVVKSGSTAGVIATSALPTGSWSHLALSYDGAKLRIYVGGVLKATKSTGSAGASAAKLRIGHNQTLGTYFNGLIDEVRLYDEALSENQIQADRDTGV
jgi:concanavalin A-like lectin/glucanase superfamily protein/subtilase family protein/peptidase inhibitor I9